MVESTPTTVQIRRCTDGTEDVIISLPQDMLRELNLDVGDALSAQLIGGLVVLKPVRHPVQQPAIQCAQPQPDQMFRVCHSLPTRCWSREHFCLLARYAEILSITQELFGKREAAERWLDLPARGLGGQVPYDLLWTYTGYVRVRDLLMRILHGFCA